jgi:MerR family transcriptional regulator, light-induced transcriptional regulator
MGIYSIRDLEQLSGIKAHTIRIWEHRYKLIIPFRSATNIRNYSGEHLKLLLNISLLRSHGIKISKIAGYSLAQIQNEVLNVSNQNAQYPDQIIGLTGAMIDLDEEKFESVISQNIEKHGFENVMLKIIYPFLTKIGTLWITGSIGPMQEHFISSLIRQKIITAIDGLKKGLNHNYLTFVLYLPEGEFHEIGLLFAHYIIKSRQHKVIYLGQSLPQADLEYVCNIQKPDYIFTSITSSPGDENIDNYLEWLSKKFNNLKILITGYQVATKNISARDNVSKIIEIEDLLKIIA